MLIIGDVHGKWIEYLSKIRQYPNDLSIQIGDMGVGFPKSKELQLPENAFWFRGNHDSPEVAKAHPNYLGDYGSKIIGNTKIFGLAERGLLIVHIELKEFHGGLMRNYPLENLIKQWMNM